MGSGLPRQPPVALRTWLPGPSLTAAPLHRREPLAAAPGADCDDRTEPTERPRASHREHRRGGQHRSLGPQSVSELGPLCR